MPGLVRAKAPHSPEMMLGQFSPFLGGGFGVCFFFWGFCVFLWFSREVS